MENKKNKKKILIISVAAVVALAVVVSVIVALAVNSGDKPGSGDDTAIDDSGVGELASGDKNGDPENAGKEPDKVETDEKGNPVDSVNGGENADPDDSSSSDSKNNSDTPSDSTGTPTVPGISGYIPGPSIAPKDTDENDPADPSDPDDPEYDPSDPENIDPDDEIDPNEPLESTVVVEPGKTGADWPSSLPSVIPVFGGDIVFSNNCSYEKYDAQELWFMGWDGTVSAYNSWINALANAGFVAVPDVYGYYVNGEYLLDITTEEEFTRDEDGEQISTGNIWVSMDVYHAFDVVYPDEIKDIMPAFDLNATLDYWNVDKKGRTVSVFYQTAGNWSADASILSNALSSAGFSVSNGNASKSVGGVTVNVSWSDCKIVITY